MNEPLMDLMRRYRFKKLLLLDAADTGLRAVIAIHSTALGPAGGGVRFWPYPSEKEARVDAMRLARGMTYKYAAAGRDLGSGQAVIIGCADAEFRAFYDRKRREGKRHTQALIALAGRRVNVVWAMLRDGTTFENRTAA